MKANPTIGATTAVPARPGRCRAVAAALAVLVAVGATGCSSDPNPKRVAEDIIVAELDEGRISEAEADCLLGKLKNYTDDALIAIDEGLEKGEGSTERTEAESALRAYELDLSACTN